jgi:hypothetical protein
LTGQFNQRSVLAVGLSETGKALCQPLFVKLRRGLPGLIHEVGQAGSVWKPQQYYMQVSQLLAFPGTHFPSI